MNDPVSVSDPATPQSSTKVPKVVYDVLLAEDNMVNQMLIVKSLERHDHRVEIVEDGQNALEAVKDRLYKGRPYSVILVSLHLLPSDKDEG